MAPPGGGISLFRTLSKYPNGKVLDVPELITTETWEQFGRDYYEGYQAIEPATGATIGGRLANMMSIFTWNCNPYLNGSLCDVLTLVNDGSLCYTRNDSANYMYACNAGNVFTPKIQGGKVLPVWWLYATPDADEVVQQSIKVLEINLMMIVMFICPMLCCLLQAYDVITFAMDVRFGLSIVVLLVPIVGAAAIAVIVWKALYYKK